MKSLFRIFHLVAVIFLLVTANGVADSQVRLVAVTESGREVVIHESTGEIKKLIISLKGFMLPPTDLVVDIEGIEDLTSLRDIRFDTTPQFADYDFLVESANLEIILISSSYVSNLQFLKSMKKLKAFMVELSGLWFAFGQNASPHTIDLQSNNDLEYFGLMYCGLESFPIFTNIPESLQYIDLTGNEFSITLADTEKLEVLTSVEKVFVWGAEIDPSLLLSFPNLTTDQSDGIVPEYWKSEKGPADD